MPQELRIGVRAADDGSEGWIRILRQEMLPWDPVDGPERRIILFSGSLYLLTFGGPRFVGIITPLGGLALIAGWVLFAVTILRQ